MGYLLVVGIMLWLAEIVAVVVAVVAVTIVALCSAAASAVVVAVIAVTAPVVVPGVSLSLVCFSPRILGCLDG